MKALLILLAGILVTTSLFGQKANDIQVHGDFIIDAQSYRTDSAIGANEIPEDVAMNAYGNINFTIGKFYGGMRFEAFMPPLLGFDPRWEGVGIPYRYFGYNQENLDVTVGSFYEQYGSGMVNRSYWEWYLGYDNFYDGVRVRYRPAKGLFRNIKADSIPGHFHILEINY